MGKIATRIKGNDPFDDALSTTTKQDEIIAAVGGGTDEEVRLATDSGDANIEYVGKAIPGSATSAAVWQISRIDNTTGLVLEFADGNSSFDNIWDNRESLSYS